MYDLEFDQAHKTFAEMERLHPADPLGPVSNAAAYLFSELDHLQILQSEFFLDDHNFKTHHKLTPDASARRAFDREIERATELSRNALARSPRDENALFATTMVLGLRADYDALIDKRYLASLRDMKAGRLSAEKLLSIDPNYYDAYLAVGVENYMLSLKPAPARWLLQLGGAETDRKRGIDNLRLTAEKGHYLRPYACLLLAVAALRDKDSKRAKAILTYLTRKFPHNRLYREELDRLQL